MRRERRQVQRKRPEGISYFQFEAGSGGIVLNASQRGLAFQAASAIQQLGPSRIWISPHPEERIEMNGDVVWTDRSKKAGGLRFVEPGREIGNRIRDWLKPAIEDEALELSGEVPMPTRMVHEGPRIRSKSQGHDENPSPPTVASVSNVEANEERPPIPSPTCGLTPLFASDLTWQPHDSYGSRGRFARSMATGFLFGVIVLTAAVLIEKPSLIDKLRSKVGNSLIHLGEKLNGRADLNPPAPLPSLPNQARPSEQSLPAVEAVPNRHSQGTAESPANARDPAGRKAEQFTDTINPRGHDAVERSSNYRNAHFAQKRSAEVARLWSAVGSGDSAAEVELARLYLRGDGVPRNCEQARVLLRAAARSGSREARQQLQKMPTNGCR